MTILFTEIAARNLPCELYGSETTALYGGGWDNDRIYCTDKDCGAEIVFATTTSPSEPPPADLNAVKADTAKDRANEEKRNLSKAPDEILRKIYMHFLNMDKDNGHE